MLATSSPLIHQAYFGAVGGTSHGELASSLPDRDLRAFLSAFTDRPGVVPASFTLRPYLTAATHDGYYLLCRTWPDTAVARPGMVFTQVLILSLQQASELADLSAALSLFVAVPPPIAERTTPLLPLRINTAAVSTVAQPQYVPASWLAIAGQLLGLPAGSSVLTVGEASQFEELLQALWRSLPAALRPLLTWSTRFTPSGTKEILPPLVYIPAELEEKWRGKELLLLASEKHEKPQTPVDQLLFGGEQQVDFQAFVASLQLSPDSLRVLTQCQWAYQWYQRVHLATATTDDLLALVRALHRLQPNPNKAREIKQLAVEALAQALAAEDGAQALTLRNLPLESFRTGEEQLGRAVADSVRRISTATAPLATTQLSLLDYVAEADPARTQNWWQQTAKAAFAQTLTSGTVAGARMVWRGLTHTTTTRTYLLGLLPLAADWELQLQDAVPALLAADVAEAVVDFSVRRQWWALAATALAAAYTPAEALKRLVEVEKPLALSESSRVVKLARAVADAPLVELALAIPNSQLLALAGERCGRHPALLASLDVHQPAWHTIWAVALTRTQSITLGLPNPAAIVQAFLAMVATGQAHEQVPLELIATSSFANVLQLPERASLWGQLSEKIKPHFVRATLDALVEQILTQGWTTALEPVLTTAAQAREFNTRLLSQYRNEPAAVLAVNDILHNLTDNYLKDYLYHLPVLDSATAIRFGKLVGAKRWRQSADALFSRAKSNSAFWPALQECAGMFSLWDKVFYPTLFNHKAVPTDAWDVLTQLMSSLYRRGPEERGVWERAGGDITKISIAQSPADQWESAIALLRRGADSNISVNSLLQIALQHYPGNPDLRAFTGATHLSPLWHK